LAICPILAQLHNRHHRETPRGQAWVASHGAEGAKVLVLKDGPEGIPEGEIGMAFGKGGTGHTGGLFWHRCDEVRVE
jgi:hypothetical protein